MNTKICNRCQIEKPISEFYTRTNKSGGTKYPSVNCKTCDRKRVSKFYCQNRIEKKSMAVEYKGGKCIKCGYNNCLAALEFHHRNPIEKDPEIAQFSRRSLDEITKRELDKCDLVCSNCHRELHEAERTNGRRRVFN